MKPSQYIEALFGRIKNPLREHPAQSVRDWTYLFPALRKFRIESTLFVRNDPELLQLQALYEDIYAEQLSKLEALICKIPLLKQIVFTQSFPYNCEFGLHLPVSLRGDIDIFISKAISKIIETQLIEVGFAKRIYIDDVLTEISESLASELLPNIDREFPKALPWSKLLPLPEYKIENFSSSIPFGPLIILENKHFLLFQLEETFSYNSPSMDERIVDYPFTESWLNAHRSNVFGLIITAALRVQSGVKFNRLRLRTILEASILINNLRVSENATLLATLSNEADFGEAIENLLDMINFIESANYTQFHAQSPISEKQRSSSEDLLCRTFRSLDEAFASNEKFMS